MRHPMVLAVASICISTAAQFMLKAGVASEAVRGAMLRPLARASWQVFLSEWRLGAGFALYACGAVLWLGVLRQWDVSKAYPLVGLGFVLTLFMGWWLGEAVSLPRLLGVALIVGGVILVSGT